MEPTFLGPLAAWTHSPPPRKKAKSRVLLVHGISEHSARHLNTIEFLTKHGHEVVRFDLRGAGLSGGRRQYCERFEDYVDDVVTVFNWVCSTKSDLPLFVLGHSLGGAIATHFAALYGRSLHGLVLSAPAYQVGTAISPIAIAVGKALARFTPTFYLPKAADYGFISRDREVVAAFDSDPLTFHQSTFQQGVEVLRGLSEMPEKVAEILTPVLFVHGSADRIIRLEGSFELVRGIGSADRTLHVFPGSYHEIHNDLDKESYFALLELWLKKHR